MDPKAQAPCCCGTSASSPSPPPEPSQPCCCCSAEPRRGFCAQLTAIVIGAILFVPALVSGIITFLNPLRSKSQAGLMVRMTTLDGIPADGTPQKFPVVADRQDAWTRYAAEPVGAVYLRRTGEKKVEALQVICPHAGCFIALDPASKQFYCPCHTAKFDISGKRSISPCDSPRDMDQLEVEIRNGTEVWVKFEKYRTGTPQKIVEA